MAFAMSSVKPSFGATLKARAQTRSVVSNASKGSWAPGFDVPKHLEDCSLPGAFGFDPLNLGVDEEKLKWYAQAELVHARFAMLGAAGVLVPELASSAGLSWAGAGVPWYEAGKFEYFASGLTLYSIQFFLMGWAETRRLQDYKAPGSTNQDPVFSGNKLPDGNVPGYPGGIFDPFGWAKGDTSTLQEKEIKNGRLAMLAMLGFYAQAYTTGTTPLANLSAHLSAPWDVNVWTNDLARL